ncbi:uncharacterized protein [Onthophagus taurus]|uniref:uncharacterized protein n=1 Tax=Onthophagus taurus TaxID=166361 RepID=UPI0039BDC07A
MKVKILLVFTIGIVSSQAADLKLLDIAPEEADQYINQQDQSLRYAPQIETRVPSVRYIGNQPHQVIEDIYLANQYHGQNGLGDYVYGYAVPDIAKSEQKKANQITGSYQYINGGGQEIKVKYWDNGNGFHQEDNIPQILPRQVEDSPEVKAAKEEHLRRWQEEAERNSKPPAYPYSQQPQDSQSNYNNYNNVDYSGQYSENQQNYAQTTEAPSKWEYKPSEEEKGPPRGFFYKFDYPVGVIVSQGGYEKKN